MPCGDVLVGQFGCGYEVRLGMDLSSCLLIHVLKLETRLSRVEESFIFGTGYTYLKR